uniref:Myosin-G heavy chain n=1 Tax=Lygus hesperus TaxID=30085 RepID=A0A0A9WMW4_LYGHE
MTSVGASPAVQGNESSTSNAALRLALQAMKERCQQLQNRLSMMEEENLQLRIERHSIPGVTPKSHSDVGVDSTSLLRKVEELSRQKSKLSHHIYMVANENKHLWEHLSKLTEDKSCDGSSDPSNLSIGASKPKKSLLTVLNHQEGNQLSLDEIPLRISPILSKNTSNPVEWNSASIKECEYPIMDVDDDDEAEMDGIVREELMEILGNIEEEKRLLKQQQQGLKAAIDVISKLSRSSFMNNNPCLLGDVDETRSCTTGEYDNLHSMSSEMDETNRSEGEIMKVSNGVTLRNKENNFEDRICPLCTKFYAKSTPFDEFNDHVLSHFVEDTDQDSHLSFHEIVA